MRYSELIFDLNEEKKIMFLSDNPFTQKFHKLDIKDLQYVLCTQSLNKKHEYIAGSCFLCNYDKKYNVLNKKEETYRDLWLIYNIILKQKQITNISNFQIDVLKHIFNLKTVKNKSFHFKKENNLDDVSLIENDVFFNEKTTLTHEDFLEKNRKEIEEEFEIFYNFKCKRKITYSLL